MTGYLLFMAGLTAGTIITAVPVFALLRPPADVTWAAIPRVEIPEHTVEQLAAWYHTMPRTNRRSAQ